MELLFWIIGMIALVLCIVLASVLTASIMAEKFYNILEEIATEDIEMFKDFVNDVTEIIKDKNANT